MPNFKLALEQVFIGSIDIVMASLVLYSVLICFVEIDFVTFMGAFIIAQVLGVYSQVPGGLGVFGQPSDFIRRVDCLPHYLLSAAAGFIGYCVTAV